MTADPLLLAHDLHAPDRHSTVVLLHSLALDRTVWAPLIEPLSRTHAVLAVDLRGHGASPADKGFSIEDMADDVAATLAELGRDRVGVVGLSMGGCVAQAFAVRYPERVEQLALIDTTAWYGPDAASAWAKRADKAQQEGLPSLSQFQLTRWFSDEFRLANEALCKQLLDVFAANDLGSYVSACHALGAMDLREQVTAIAVPTVIVVGEDDPATSPAHAADLHSRIAGSAMHVVPNAKHLTPLERPDEVLGHLREVLG